MKNPIILRHKKTISFEESQYWKNLFYRIIKIGTELEVAPPKGVVRKDFEENIRVSLTPSGKVEELGKLGVWDVQTEHCGVEIRIIGRQPHFGALQKQYSQIMNILNENGSRPRPTCGLHFHMLAPGLAEPVPEIILANLWNLVRRYAPELKLLTSCGDDRKSLCRRRNHNSHMEMVKLSPGAYSMQEIQEILKNSTSVPEHQNFLNLEHIKFDDDGNVNPFHLEFRFPDAHLSPTAITATTFLFLALLLKAVDLSQYGVVHVGKVQSWLRKKEIMNYLSNNEGNLSTSDTSKITDEILEELQNGTYELLDLLAPTFEWFDDQSSLDVLLALAKTPMSLMRCQGMDWTEIENSLSQKIQRKSIELDKTSQTLMQIIEFGEFSKFNDEDTWLNNVRERLLIQVPDLSHRLIQLDHLRGIKWDERQGTYVFRS